ncbi:MAG: thermonuclease family protein [Pseudomonadota bacterium]
MAGTTFTAKVDRVVDGDTVRILIDGESESVRILALDTEETRAGSKPKTPLGTIASDRAKALLSPGDEVEVMLPGNEPLEVALKKYRGNFGRLLTYITLPDGRDFQEVMIREGMSPYFQKYGYAHFQARHTRYVDAERAAQAEARGVWDQLRFNGSVMRAYAPLCTWWDLRARIIEGYREIKRRVPEANLFNTRNDYDRLTAIAEAGEETTVFMELRDFTPTSGDHILFFTGSREQPYQLFIPHGNAEKGADILNFLLTRYVAGGETEPRRSYAYVTGKTKMFDGRPEIVVTSLDQITDWPDAALERAVSTLAGPVSG